MAPAAAGRVLTQLELNRAVLARQLLLERTRLPIPRAVERLGGIQNQYAPNGYIRLWSCLRDFDREALTRALERRSVVQATLMRGTIHLVSAADYWLFAAGTRRAYRQWWERVHRAQHVDLDAAIERVQDFVRGTTRTLDQLKGLIRELGLPAGVPGDDLVRVPPAGTWGARRAHTFALAEDWLGPCTVTEDEGLEHLVRRYLGGFGPGTLDELARWAAVPAAFFADVLARMKLRRFRDENDRELLDLPRSPLPAPETFVPVRFLPTFDGTLLVHARRAEIISEEYRPRIFHTKAPQSFPTFLVDGAVAGTWKYDGRRVRIEPFHRLARGVLRELREEAERLTAFHS